MARQASKQREAHKARQAFKRREAHEARQAFKHREAHEARQASKRRAKQDAPFSSILCMCRSVNSQGQQTGNKRTRNQSAAQTSERFTEPFHFKLRSKPQSRANALAFGSARSKSLRRRSAQASSSRDASPLSSIGSHTTQKEQNANPKDADALTSVRFVCDRCAIMRKSNSEVMR